MPFYVFDGSHKQGSLHLSGMHNSSALVLFGSKKEAGMSGKREMTTHLVCVLCLKRVMAVQVYTVEQFPVEQSITYFLSKIPD